MEQATGRVSRDERQKVTSYMLYCQRAEDRHIDIRDGATPLRCRFAATIRLRVKERVHFVFATTMPLFIVKIHADYYLHKVAWRHVLAWQSGTWEMAWWGR